MTEFRPMFDHWRAISKYKTIFKNQHSIVFFSGVRPYKCNLCEKSFTQRCSLESHCLKVHGVAHQYEYKQRRSKVNNNKRNGPMP